MILIKRPQNQWTDIDAQLGTAAEDRRLHFEIQAMIGAGSDTLIVGTWDANIIAKAEQQLIESDAQPATKTDEPPTLSDHDQTLIREAIDVWLAVHVEEPNVEQKRVAMRGLRRRV